MHCSYSIPPTMLRGRCKCTKLIIFNKMQCMGDSNPENRDSPNQLTLEICYKRNMLHVYFGIRHEDRHFFLPVEQFGNLIVGSMSDNTCPEHMHILSQFILRKHRCHSFCFLFLKTSDCEQMFWSNVGHLCTISLIRSNVGLTQTPLRLVLKHT